jgi:hypothetical protein
MSNNIDAGRTAFTNWYYHSQLVMDTPQGDWSTVGQGCLNNSGHSEQPTDISLDL